MASIVASRLVIFVINIIRLFKKILIHKIAFLVYWRLLTESNITLVIYLNYEAKEQYIIFVYYFY